MKRGKAYVKGVVGSPDGVLPSFVRLDPPVPYREVGTDGGMTRGFMRFDGTTSQFTLADLADYERLYPGDASDDQAVTNMVDRGLYDVRGDVPDFEPQRHVDRVRAMGADGEHFGEISATQASDLLMRAGKTHYPDPDDFVDEAVEMGISKAIPLSQNQSPPVIAPGATRCWIVHPDTDVGFGVIGYAHLQEVVYTEPADGNVPQYVQDFASAGRLDVVDIEEPDQSGPNAQVTDDWDGSDAEPTVDLEDIDDPDGIPDMPGVGGDGGPADGPDDGADPRGQTPETVVAAPWSDADVVRLSDVDLDRDNLGYNDLKAMVASLDDVDVGQHPSKPDLLNALRAAQGGDD